VLYGIRPNSLPSAPQLQISVDRVQAQAMGLSLTDVYNALQMELAPFYIDQFTYGGRVKRVYMQADAPYRMGIDAFQHIYTPSLFTNSAATGTSQRPGLEQPPARRTAIWPRSIRRPRIRRSARTTWCRCPAW
jgi:multidrug efflux pump